MRLVLHGGFGEKGRTSVAVESAGYRLLIDAGVNTSARDRDGYYPAISEAALAATDAIVITHGHEDHVGALGWCLAKGFRGRIFMTTETLQETDRCLADYSPPEFRALVRDAHVERLPVANDAVVLGPLRIATGRSGHIAGGVWCSVDDGRSVFLFCGDVVPASAIFATDALPRCSAIAIDASYGDDNVASRDRAAQVSEWVLGQPAGCVLPTPLYGRSAELLAIVPGCLALAPGMRDALHAQIAGGEWLVDGMTSVLAARLRVAIDWHEGAALPRAALLCHDGMGLSGPSRRILEMADAQQHPTLFTGHVPDNSPGDRMVTRGRAAWIRLPTHPTRSENVTMVAASGAGIVFGHSCDRAALTRLAEYLPSLRVDLATGDFVDL